MYFPINVLIFSNLIFSILMMVSSVNWMSLWVSLEFNSLIFISMIKNDFLKFNSDLMMKYFLIQSFASLLILVSLFLSPYFSFYLFVLALFLKMGFPPFHWWVLDIMKFFSWKLFFVFLTVQKVGLMILLSSYFNWWNLEFFLFLVLLIFVISVKSVFFTTNLYQLMMFSSMIHSGWMMVILLFMPKMFLIYFVMYSLVFYGMLSTLEESVIMSFIQFNKISMFLLYMFIFMGFPPFIVFFMKWLVLSVVVNVSWFYSFLMIFTSIMTLYFYYRIFYLGVLMKWAYITSSWINVNVLDYLVMLCVMTPVMVFFM